MATLNGIIDMTVFTATQPIKTKTLYAIDFYSVHQTVVPYKILVMEVSLQILSSTFKAKMLGTEKTALKKQILNYHHRQLLTYFVV